MESRAKQRKNENECVRREGCVMDVYLSFKANNRRVIFREKSDRTGQFLVM
jgi:sulfur transfer protein SufE